MKAYALERLEWTGRMPFEIETITIKPKGFKITFTKPVEAKTGNDPASYVLSTFTHKYHRGYGGPEIDQTTPKVTKATLSKNGLSAVIELETLKKGHVHEFYLSALRSTDGGELLHRHAYYTVNEVPK